MIPPSPQRDEATLRVMRYLFNRMVIEEKTSWQDAAKYLPEYFLQWASTKINTAAIDKDEVLGGSSAKEIGWDFFVQLMDSPVGALQIAPMWHYVCLAHRGDPRVQVSRVHLTYNVEWVDGHVFVFSVQVPAEVMEGGCINDAFLACQAAQQFKGLQQHIIDVGLDNTHDSPQLSEKYDQTAYNQLMGMLMCLFKKQDEMGADLVAKAALLARQLTPEQSGEMLKWFRRIQMAVNPPIPPAVLARMEKKRQAYLASQRPAGPKGGFAG